MDKDQLELKRFLIEQLYWSNKQDMILGEIELRLNEMRNKAEYARSHELSTSELNKLNQEVQDLQAEVQNLEKLLHNVVH